MAAGGAGTSYEHLMCPLCIDIYEDATLLSCGHTFCKRCLKKYDERHTKQEYMVCPVCRHVTPFRQQRVNGLPPNVAVLGLVDELRRERDNIRQERVSTDADLSMCSLHRQEKNDLFCEDCSVNICLKCVFTHHYHTIKNKQTLKEEILRRVHDLNQRFKSKNVYVEKNIQLIETQRKGVHLVMQQLETKITDGYEKKARQLKENERALLEEVKSIQRSFDDDLDSLTAQSRQHLEQMASCLAVIMNGRLIMSLEGDSLVAHTLICSDLDNLLQRDVIDHRESASSIRDIAESTQFRAAGMAQLAIGRIDPGMGLEVPDRALEDETSNDGLSSVTNKERCISNGMQSARPEKAIKRLPVSSISSLITVVDLPSQMIGLAALSQNSVVIGYGSNIAGADRFSSLGDMSQHITEIAGPVHDIAMLPDGRSVVSNSSDTITVYKSNSVAIDFQCRTNKGFHGCRVCTDHDNNIYAVNGNEEIYIYQVGNANPQRVIPTGDIRPRQICVTTTGVMITSSTDTASSAVTVFDREGRVGSSIIGTEEDERMYATVDSQDRVFIARVKRRSDMLRLSIYGLLGTCLVHQNQQNLRLSSPVHHLHPWCYLVCLSSNMLAFACLNRLFFIQLPTN